MQAVMFAIPSFKLTGSGILDLYIKYYICLQVQCHFDEEFNQE